MDFDSIKQSLPRKLWNLLDNYQKYAYLKSFIPFCWDQRYGVYLRELDMFLENET